MTYLPPPEGDGPTLVTPTLHFPGTCADAVALYRRALGAQVDVLLRYADRDRDDWDEPLAAEQEQWVYHAEIRRGAQRLMLADDLALQRPGDGMSLTLTFDSAPRVRRAFHALADDEGRIVHPLHSTTCSSCQGVVVDRFGMRWGLTTEQTER